jgi:hypothetical protein
VAEVESNRQTGNGITGVIYFDLQNDIALPSANIPNFNYKKN